jgi:hypothetical protein
MTGEQLTLEWSEPCNTPPPTDTPTPGDLRQAEINDLRNQGGNLAGIYRATTIHAPEYL